MRLEEEALVASPRICHRSSAGSTSGLALGAFPTQAVELEIVRGLAVSRDRGVVAELNRRLRWQQQFPPRAGAIESSMTA